MNTQWNSLKKGLVRGAFLLSTVAFTTLYACDSNNSGQETNADANEAETTDTVDTAWDNAGHDNTGVGTTNAPDTTSSGMTTDTVGQRAGDLD